MMSFLLVGSVMSGLSCPGCHVRAVMSGVQRLGRAVALVWTFANMLRSCYTMGTVRWLAPKTDFAFQRMDHHRIFVTQSWSRRRTRSWARWLLPVLSSLRR